MLEAFYSYPQHPSGQALALRLLYGYCLEIITIVVRKEQASLLLQHKGAKGRNVTPPDLLSPGVAGAPVLTVSKWPLPQFFMALLPSHSLTHVFSGIPSLTSLLSTQGQRIP